MAFLFVHGIWGLEQDCISADSGLGQLCTPGELIRGVKTPGGGMLGSGKRSSGNLWYSPKSADLTKAVQLTQFGYEGDGFKR